MQNFRELSIESFCEKYNWKSSLMKDVKAPEVLNLAFQQNPVRAKGFLVIAPSQYKIGVQSYLFEKLLQIKSKSPKYFAEWKKKEYISLLLLCPQVDFFIQNYPFGSDSGEREIFVECVYMFRKFVDFMEKLRGELSAVSARDMEQEIRKKIEVCVRDVKDILQMAKKSNLSMKELFVKFNNKIQITKVSLKVYSVLCTLRNKNLIN